MATSFGGLLVGPSGEKPPHYFVIENGEARRGGNTLISERDKGIEAIRRTQLAKCSPESVQIRPPSLFVVGMVDEQ